MIGEGYVTMERLVKMNRKEAMGYIVHLMNEREEIRKGWGVGISGRESMARMREVEAIREIISRLVEKHDIDIRNVREEWSEYVKQVEEVETR